MELKNQTSTRKRVATVANFLEQKTIVAFAFLLPLFFLPITFDIFEFNKTYLFYTTVCALLLLNGLKTAATRKLYIRRTFLDAPLLLVLVTAVLASFFAENKFYAVLGFYGNWSESLITLVFMYVFYYLVSSSITRKTLRQTLSALVVSSFISAAIFILTAIGVNILGQGWSNITLSTLGSVSSTALFYALIAIVGVHLMLESKSPFAKSIYALLTSVIVLPLGMVSGLSFIAIALLGSSIVLISTPPKTMERSKYYISLFLVSSAILGSVFLIPQVKSAVGIDYRINKNISAGARNSWAVTSSVIGVKPFFGAGLGNFYTHYTRLKPITVNSQNIWNSRFAKASSEYINILATAGILGFLAWIYLIYKLANRTWKPYSTLLANDNENEDLRNVIKALLSALLLSWVFYPASLSTLALFFLLAAFTAKLEDAKETGPKALSANSAYTVAVISTLLVGVVCYFGYRGWGADYMFGESVRDLAQGGTKTYTLQRQAVILNPYFDLYRRNYAQTNLALANAIAQKKDIGNVDAQTVQQLISQAVREARVATEVIAPQNVDNWEVRGSIYRSLNRVANNAIAWSIDSYNTAVSLDPNNPRLRVDLGGLYYLGEDYNSAATIFATATRLKNDYANAHYNLAQAYKKLNQNQAAKTEMEIVLRLIPQNSPDYEKAKEELDQIKSLAESGEITKPTVEQLEAQGAQPAEQQPLVEPGKTEEFNLESGNITVPLGEQKTAE